MTRWARTRWVRTRWPPTKCRIEDGDIGDTRSPWPGQKWTRCKTTRSRSTAVRSFDFVAPKKRVRRAEGVCWVYMHLAGADNAHSISSRNQRNKLAWNVSIFLRPRRHGSERRGTQPKRVRPVKTVV